MWRQLIHSLYPDVFHTTYCVPPVHFPGVAYTQAAVASQSALALTPPVDIDCDGPAGHGGAERCHLTDTPPVDRDCDSPVERRQRHLTHTAPNSPVERCQHHLTHTAPNSPVERRQHHLTDTAPNSPVERRQHHLTDTPPVDGDYDSPAGHGGAGLGHNGAEKCQGHLTNNPPVDGAGDSPAERLQRHPTDTSAVRSREVLGTSSEPALGNQSECQTVDTSCSQPGSQTGAVLTSDTPAHLYSSSSPVPCPASSVCTGAVGGQPHPDSRGSSSPQTATGDTVVKGPAPAAKPAVNGSSINRNASAVRAHRAAAGPGARARARPLPKHGLPATPPPTKAASSGIWSPASNQLTRSARRVFVSDLQDDFAQMHVLTNLQELGHQQGEVMFVLSQLEFGNYLKRPSYYAAAVASSLPVPADLGEDYRSGELDVLIIHRHYGVMVGEIKSVGRREEGLRRTRAQADRDVVDRVRKAVTQLNRSETVVQHLVSDVAADVRVKKAIFLPYVSREQLGRVLQANLQLQQDVCDSLGAASPEDAVQLCVCREHLSDPVAYWHVTPHVLAELSQWWTSRMTSSKNTWLDDRSYLDIVARFVGPATTVRVHCPTPPRVEVRTAGQAVSELGNRLARLVLTPHQLALLTSCPSRLWLTGPPGTGKTVVLVLMAMQWLQQGGDVYLVSSYSGNAAITKLMEHQIQTTLSSREPGSSARLGQLHALYYDVETNTRDIMTLLMEMATLYFRTPQKIAVVVDEVYFTDRVARSHSRFEGVVNRLLAWAATDVQVWLASVQKPSAHLLPLPHDLQLHTLTLPLRSAPVVVRELETAIRDLDNILPYQAPPPSLHLPCDGLKVIHLHHHGDGHVGRWPVDCEQCGCDVAHTLRRLHVGVTARTNLPNSPSPLRYNDVFVVTTSGTLRDNVIDGTGRMTSAASGVVRGLRGMGLPVTVLEANPQDKTAWRKKVEDTALAATDSVTVAHYRAVLGLERKVVVRLPARLSLGQGLQRHDDGLDDVRDRLYSMSRCSTQLVVVHVPQVQQLARD